MPISHNVRIATAQIPRNSSIFQIFQAVISPHPHRGAVKNNSKYKEAPHGLGEEPPLFSPQGPPSSSTRFKVVYNALCLQLRAEHTELETLPYGSKNLLSGKKPRIPDVDWGRLSQNQHFSLRAMTSPLKVWNNFISFAPATGSFCLH